MKYNLSQITKRAWEIFRKAKSHFQKHFTGRGYLPRQLKSTRTALREPKRQQRSQRKQIHGASGKSWDMRLYMAARLYLVLISYGVVKETEPYIKPVSLDGHRCRRWRHEIPH